MGEATSTGDDYVDELADLDGQVDTCPQVLAARGDGGSRVVHRHEGALGIRGIGHPAGRRRRRPARFRTRCRIDLDTLTLRITADATFDVTGPDGVDTCWF